MIDYTYLKYFIGSATVIACYLFRRWLQGGTCYSKARLDGKTVVITGANCGIGKETALDMAIRGATVVMACRDVQRSQSSLHEIREKSRNSNVFLMTLDLSSLESIRKFVDSFLSEYKQLHILINNAGVFFPFHQATSDGFEMNFGVNHLGHFALTNLLLERMVVSGAARIINVSSNAYKMCKELKLDGINTEKDYKGYDAYGYSKLANIMFTKELSRKLEGTNVTSYAVNPGFVLTNITRNFKFKTWQLILFWLPQRIICKSVEQGAQTTIYCAVQEGIENQSGMYFSDCALYDVTDLAKDAGMSKKLWEFSEETTHVKFPL